MIALSDATVHDADVVVLLTDHDVFDYKQIADHARAILDTRNRFAHGPTVQRL